ncbi:MAG: ATP-binding cassette domain-containing protein [Intrasporangium sp.]|uniref:ATP-binding cassette domain-containing protein n=1 Tax=Intrasporangium sp. TaxID=1925024 RepID=UPI00264A0AAD|nr:ATP-binding cassette domain-containing protein [Intrasporangium sp.]MDN5794878.1 ATP-binding cassette domain-containing protein [Intrasporangium sp.]
MTAATEHTKADTASDGDPLVVVRDLTRIFRRPRQSFRGPVPTVTALDGVTFDIQRGERFGIVGESGSGKSTLIRIMSGLDQPTSGSILFDGKQITGRKERDLTFLREELQFVFQDPMGSLNPRMRVRDIIAEPLVARGKRNNRARVVELLQAVGLPATAADRFPHQFSGGQRQRISIARALAPSPKVLVADEPVSALDVSVQAQILNLLADLVDEYNLTLVFVSHDLAVVRRVCDTVAVLHHGDLVEHGPTEQIYTQPSQAYTRRLIAAAPTIKKALGGVDAAALAEGMIHVGADPAD